MALLTRYQIFASQVPALRHTPISSSSYHRPLVRQQLAWSSLSQSLPARSSDTSLPSCSSRCPGSTMLVQQLRTGARPLDGSTTSQRLRMVKTAAGTMDIMPTWTLDQIAGLAFSLVMVLFIVSAKQVDIFFARQQRRQLGLCEECGGVFEPGTCQVKVCPMRKK